MVENVPEVFVPAQREYPQGVAGEDYNKVARVIVQRTGLLGMGRPLFLGMAGDVSLGGEAKRGTKAVTIKGPTKMYYPYCETSAERVVAGMRVQEVFITPVEEGSSE